MTAQQYELATPSTKQPTVVYLRKNSHRVPVGASMHKYFVVDKITFDCPLHEPAYESEQDREIANALEYTRGPNAGIFTQGHRITLYARAGAPYEYKKNGRVVFIYGYTIEGTTICITPQVNCECTKDVRVSEELYQETGEIYKKQVFDQDFASNEVLEAIVR